MHVTSEYVFNNLELEEMIIILTNIRKEFDRKYGADNKDKVYIEAEFEYIDKLLNKKNLLRLIVPLLFIILKKKEKSLQKTHSLVVE